MRYANVSPIAIAATSSTSATIPRVANDCGDDGTLCKHRSGCAAYAARDQARADHRPHRRPYPLKLTRAHRVIVAGEPSARFAGNAFGQKSRRPSRLRESEKTIVPSHV